MSAWIVSKAHIDCLVQAMVVEGIVPLDKATVTGRELWRENHRSINYRYNERQRTPAYEFSGIEAPLDDWTVFKQISCYGYQTCERPDWEKSRSYRLTEKLAAVILARLGVTRESVYDHPGWADGPWGIDRIEEAIAS